MTVQLISYFKVLFLSSQNYIKNKIKTVVMIKHVVIFKFKPFLNDEEQTEKEQEIKAALLALKEKIEVLRSIEVGININPDEEFNLVLTTTFDRFEDIEAYAKHPAHLEVVELIKPVKAGRACVDYKE
jgi:hypothetical protein